MVIHLKHLISVAHWKEIMTDPVVGSVTLVLMFQNKLVNMEGVNYMRCVFEPTNRCQTHSFNQDVPICLNVWT